MAGATSPEKIEYAAPGPGQCVLHRIGDGLYCQRADPVVAFTDGLLRQVAAGGAPGMRLDATALGKVLVIDAVGQRVCYRLERCGQPGYLLGRLC